MTGPEGVEGPDAGAGREGVAALPDAEIYAVDPVPAVIESRRSERISSDEEAAPKPDLLVMFE